MKIIVETVKNMLLALTRNSPRLYRFLLQIVFHADLQEREPNHLAFCTSLNELLERPGAGPKLFQHSGDVLLKTTLLDKTTPTSILQSEVLWQQYLSILNSDECLQQLAETMSSDIMEAVIRAKRFREYVKENDKACQVLGQVIGQPDCLDVLVSDIDSTFITTLLKRPQMAARMNDDEKMRFALDHLLLEESFQPSLAKLNFLRRLLRSQAFIDALCESEKLFNDYQKAFGNEKLWKSYQINDFSSLHHLLRSQSFIDALCESEKLFNDYQKALENEHLWKTYHTPLRARYFLNSSHFEHLVASEELVREALRAIIYKNSLLDVVLSEPHLYRTSLHKARHAFVQAFYDLEPYFPQPIEEMKQRFLDLIKRINTEAESREALVDLFCENGLLLLKNAALRFPDKRSLWVLFNELLICEDYYFECDTDTPYIIDGGAHFGFAVYYFKQLFPKAHITAFEPVPDLVALIQENIDRNNYKNVTVFPYALSGTDEDACFFVSDTDSMAGSLSERRRYSGDTVNEIHVQCRHLSTYITQTVHYLKLDIEGPEDRVIEEIESKLAFVERIFIEYHFGEGLGGERMAAIIGILERSGFDTQVAKSFSYSISSRHKPMQHVGDPYSAVIWAQKRSLKVKAPQ